MFVARRGVALGRSVPVFGHGCRGGEVSSRWTGTQCASLRRSGFTGCAFIACRPSSGAVFSCGAWLAAMDGPSHSRLEKPVAVAAASEGLKVSLLGGSGCAGAVWLWSPGRASSRTARWLANASLMVRFFLHDRHTAWSLLHALRDPRWL